MCKLVKVKESEVYHLVFERSIHLPRGKSPTLPRATRSVKRGNKCTVSTGLFCYVDMYNKVCQQGSFGKTLSRLPGRVIFEESSTEAPANVRRRTPARKGTEIVKG